MRQLKLLIAVAMFVGAAAACDEGTTPNNAGTGADYADDGSLLDQTAPMNDRVAPLPNGQRAPLPTDQRTPLGGQTAPGASSGGGVANECMNTCARAASMGCDVGDLDCEGLCAVVTSSGDCQLEAGLLLACASIATDCTGLMACGEAADSLDTCVEGGDVTDPTLTIRSPSCYVSNQCAGCTAVCDQCVCLGTLAGVSSSQLEIACGSSC